MQKYLKFIAELPLKLKLKIFAVLDLIENNELKNLDCKKLRGMENIFRIRVGNIRIIFLKNENQNEVISVGFRDDKTYKKLS